MEETDKPTIMVVDDDPEVLRVMALTLARQGFRVDARAVPPNWIDLEEVRPSLIFLDVELMPFSGVRICKSIKENLPTWHLPIVLISGHPLETLEQEARYCHADAVLMKPFSATALYRLADRYAYGKSLTGNC